MSARSGRYQETWTRYLGGENEDKKNNRKEEKEKIKICLAAQGAPTHPTQKTDVSIVLLTSCLVVTW
jgi:hypothetical protein